MSPPTPRVLHLVDNLEFGGAQTVLKALFESRRTDAGLFLMALRRGDREMAIDQPNVRVHPDTARFSLRPVRDIVEFVRAQRVRIIHCHLFRAEVLGYLAARELAGAVKLVFHEHGEAAGVQQGNYARHFAFRAFQRIAAPRVDLHIAISVYMRSAIARVSGRGLRESVVLYNPVRRLCSQEGEPATQAAARDRLGVPREAFVVGMAGRTVAAKGWREFIAAMPMLLAMQPVYFLVAGDGPEHEAMRQEIAARNLASHGRALGYVSDLATFYRALDCFVMPSHREGAGLSHLEAQLFGVPVVVCDVPGLNETVEANVSALMCRPRDPRHLAECIAALMRDPALRQRIAVAGRENAERFSIERFGAGLDALYGKLLAERA